MARALTEDISDNEGSTEWPRGGHPIGEWQGYSHRRRHVEGAQRRPSKRQSWQDLPAAAMRTAAYLAVRQHMRDRTENCLKVAELEETELTKPLPTGGSKKEGIAPVAETDVWIGKVPLKGIPIDTGSSVNLVSEQFFGDWCDRHNLTAGQRDEHRVAAPADNLRVVGGRIVNVIGGIRLPTRLTEHGEEHDVVFCMLRSSHVPALLGTPALRTLGIKLTTPANPDHDILGGDKLQAAFEAMTGGDQVRTPIIAIGDHEIASNSTVTIETARVESGDHVYELGDDTLTRFEPNTARADIEILPAIGMIDGHGNTTVSITNEMMDVAYIKRGDVLGYSTVTTYAECDHVMTANSGDDAYLSMWLAPTRIQELQERNQFIKKHLQKCGDTLTPEQVKRIEKVIYDNSSVVSMGLHDFPVANGPAMEIDTGNAMPCKQRLRPEPIKAEVFMHETINDLLANGLIVPSTSPWSSPVTIAAKKAMPGKHPFRLCCDFRILNQMTVRQTISMPRISDMVRGLLNKPFITTLDLQSAYWQMPLSRDASDKTTFTCSRGVFRWTRMPYGLANAPAAYTAMIRSVLAPIINRCGPGTRNNAHYVGAYVDDLIIASSTFDEHISLLDEVFHTLIRNKLKIGLQKCHFGVKETIYLGWSVSATGKRVNPERTAAIDFVPPPKRTRDVKSFLGLINYYRESLDHVATHALPLYALLKGKTKFTWNEAEQQSFEKLKSLLKDAVLLYHADPTRPFELFTDASDAGIAGVLEQKDEHGVSHPIGFFSRKLCPAETRYATNDKECLAVVESLKFWRQYIIGGEVSVYTDHSALLPVFNSPKESHRRSRWADQVAEYSPRMYFLKGSDNTSADFFSRYPIVEQDAEVHNRHNKQYVRTRMDGAYDIPSSNCVQPSTNDEAPTPFFEIETTEHTNSIVKNVVDDMYEIDEAETELCFFGHAEEDKPTLVMDSMLVHADKAVHDDCKTADDVMATVNDETEIGGDVTCADSDNAKEDEADCYYVDTPDVFVPELLAHESITKAQLKDADTQRLVKEVKTYPEKHTQLAIAGETLVMISPIGNGKLVPYVPDKLREPVINQSHCSPVSGHLRGAKLYSIIARRCAWPAMRKQIDEVTAKCEACIREFPGQHFRPALSPFVTDGRMERLVIDVVKVGASATGPTHALVAVDHLSRYPWVIPIMDQTASTLLDALINNIFQYFGVPKEIVADAHPSHTSEEFCATLEALGIHTNFSQGYTHNHAGQCERFNRTFVSMVRRCEMTHKLDWTVALAFVLLEYRAATCAATGFSPHFIMMGREARLPLDTILDYQSTTVNDEQTRRQQIADTIIATRDSIAHTNEQERAKMIAQYHKQAKVKPVNLKVGDCVLVKETRELTARKNVKLHPNRYTGPFKVIEIDSPKLKVTRMDGTMPETIHMSTATKSKHDIPPRYGTKRAHRELPRARPPLRQPRDTRRYDFRPRTGGGPTT